MSDETQASASPSIPATVTALHALTEALETAQHARADLAEDPQSALAALLLLRQVREQLADWEPRMIEAARKAGASWAELAHPLGVASRQAAERRYLRGRPGEAGATKEQRVQATRGQRAADRSVHTWANDNAAALRQLAGTITDLTDLPVTATSATEALHTALGHQDPARLLRPLSEMAPHLRPAHPDLADRVADIGRHTDETRENEQRHRSSVQSRESRPRRV
ncbi:type III effector protein [Streptomyces sp. NPDC001642]|uniref:type III effector protein n=1 Tax=Streptomyces sp. NPDC001642 TaxID=3154392 RepID=UPI0033323ACB